VDCQFFAVPCLEVKENTNFPQTLLGRAKTSTKYLILLKLVVITVVSIECRRFTGFALLRYTIAFKNARHYVIQSDVKPPIATCMHTNSRASRRDLIGSLNCLCLLRLATERTLLPVWDTQLKNSLR